MSIQDDIFVATESFAVTVDGQSYVINRGKTRVRAGHPLLKGREMYFEPLEVHYDVEAATARPGEKRGAPETVAPAAIPAPKTEPQAAPAMAIKANVTATQGLTTESIKPKAPAKAD